MIAVLVGASGTGKTSIARFLAENHGWFHGITTTTRPRRDSEQDGVDYNFTDDAGFRVKLNAGEFCETVEQWGYKYGSPAPQAEQDLVVVLNIAGAMTYRKMYGDNVHIIGLFCEESVRCSRISGERVQRTEVLCAELLAACDLVFDTTHVSVDTLADTINSVSRGWRRT